MGLIPEGTLEEILGRTDIVELISGYIPLKRYGRSFKALCPFHHEKTPSFVVSPDRQIYHCFGCSAGGNAFGFLMQYERLEFPEAVEMLAKKAGVAIPKSSPQSQQSQNTITQLYKINAAAAHFYINQLFSRPGEKALAYLVKRGISLDTVKAFKIGFAPEGWDNLFNHLRQGHFPAALIEKAGLAIPREGAGHYDRFRGRIVIPISDIKGNIVAFGGRVLDEGLPKYLNSPETPVYSKGKILFGLNAAKDEVRARDFTVIVEGYFDLITPYQAGVKNIVASCGTALTLEQIRMLRRYSHNVVMVYDADSAGQMATVRSLGLLVEEGLNVRVASLPEGYDPDSFVRRHGPERFRDLLDKAQDVFDYKLGVLRSKHDFSGVAGKAKAGEEMLELIHKFANAVIRSAYIKKLAEELKLDEYSLLAEFKKIKGISHPAQGQKGVSLAIQARKPASYIPERMLVKLMLEEQEFIDQIRAALGPEDFQDRSLNQIVSRIFELWLDRKKLEPQVLLNYFSDTHQSAVISELLASDWPPASDKLKLFEDCMRRMKEGRRRLKQEELCRQIKLAEAGRNENRVKELLSEFQTLAKKGI